MYYGVMEMLGGTFILLACLYILMFREGTVRRFFACLGALAGVIVMCDGGLTLDAYRILRETRPVQRGDLAPGDKTE